jgi:hypothetical protein
MRDLGDRIRTVTGVPPPDIGPIPPRSPEERAGIFNLAAAQPAQVFPPPANLVDMMAYIAGRYGGGFSSSANVTPICVEQHAGPVAYNDGGVIYPAAPHPPRDPSWQEYRRTWLETGDLSALTAMDACDPAAMSGDDWLDCDEYDALRAPVPELLPPPSARHRAATAIVLAVLLGWLLATLIYYGVI